MRDEDQRLPYTFWGKYNKKTLERDKKIQLDFLGLEKPVLYILRFGIA